MTVKDAGPLQPRRLSMTQRLARFFSPADPTEAITRADVQAIASELKMIHESLATLTRREAQVRAVLERDTELDGLLDRLRKVIAKPGIAEQVTGAIARSELQASPFPYAVVDDLLPQDLYDCLIKGLPPLELFADRPINKQQLVVPFDLAPIYSQRIWRYLATTAVPELIVPAVLAKFREPIEEWIRYNWPAVAPETVQFHSSDGRILLRRRGYRITPHRDPKWGFITCIFYLARPGDSETWGTQLFSVADDVDARGAAPHWIDPAHCTKVADVTFRPNRLLIFLNSIGAHGAEIPADAQPEALERYIYQFRIAPTQSSMAMLKGALPESQRELWAGKGADY